MLDRFKVPGLLDHLLRIEHLEREDAREAIVAPLRHWNETIAAPGEEVGIEPSESALVETVLDQVEAGKVALGEQGTGAVAGDKRPVGIEAPYLQLVLERLWDEEQREGSRVLRLQTLDRLGGATAIVRTHLDAARHSRNVSRTSPARFSVTSSPRPERRSRSESQTSPGMPTYPRSGLGRSWSS